MTPEQLEKEFRRIKRRLCCLSQDSFSVMTEVERTAISSPTVGLHVYQSDGIEGVYVYKSTGWVFAY